MFQRWFEKKQENVMYHKQVKKAIQSSKKDTHHDKFAAISVKNKVRD